MKRAVIYLRVSTKDQNYDRQEIELKALASSLGYEVVRVYEEKKSAVLRMDTREQLMEMRKLTRNDIDRIFIWDITRLSRRAIDFIALINEFSDKGICLHFKDKNIITLDDNGNLEPFMALYLYMLGMFAEMEAEALKAKMLSGKETALLKGNSYTNIAPFGYELIDKHLYIKEIEANFVREAFRLYKIGKDLQYITDIFNAQKVPLKSGRTDIVWVKGTIYQLLKNPVYYGKGKRVSMLRKATDTIPAEYITRYFDAPAIVSKELFNEVQKLFDLNKNRNDKSRVEPNLLRGVLVCGLCGKPYVLGMNNGYKIYRDSDVRANVNNRIGCRNSSAGVEITDFFVWEAIRGIYEYNTFKEKYTEEKEKNQSLYKDNEQKIADFGDRLKDLNNENNRVNTGYAKGFYTDEEAFQQKERITKELNRLNKTIEDIRTENLLLKERIEMNFDYTSYFSDKQLSLQEKKQICNELIEVATIYSYGGFQRFIQIKLKVGLIINLCFNTKTKEYFAIKDDVVTFNNPVHAPIAVRNLISDFTVTSNNNNLFEEEIFGDYSYNQIVTIMRKYGYMQKYKNEVK